MCRWIRRVYRYRRKRRLLISILVFACVILFFRLEIYTIQAGDYGTQASSRHVESLSTSVRTRGRLNTHGTENGNEQSDLLSNADGKEVLASKREADREKKLPCVEPLEKSRFREIGKSGSLVFSVWFDDRKSQHFIRILLLTSTRNPLPTLSCHFETTAKQGKLTTVAFFYQHNENHHLRYGGFIASCIVPKELDRIPCFVNISITRTAERQKEITNSMSFPVGLIDRQQSTEEANGGKYGICIPPVHGDISVEGLIEFLELSQILGASHFTFYDLEMTEDVRNVLNYYQNKGLVSVLAWNLPWYIGSDNLHYFGQVLSIMDCLYRSMKHLHFVAFHDLDEFIVPLRHDNINSLLENIHKERHCGHCFQSVIFYPSRNEEQDSVIASPLLTQRVIHRTSQATPFWTKCIVDPRRIFEQGIHHISKPIEEHYHADKVDWNIARVFHYRKCQDSGAVMQPKCSGFEVDATMLTFGYRLMRSFQSVINATNERKP